MIDASLAKARAARAPSLRIITPQLRVGTVNTALDAKYLVRLRKNSPGNDVLGDVQVRQTEPVESRRASHNVARPARSCKVVLAAPPTVVNRIFQPELYKRQARRFKRAKTHLNLAQCGLDLFHTARRFPVMLMLVAHIRNLPALQRPCNLTKLFTQTDS